VFAVDDVFGDAMGSQHGCERVGEAREDGRSRRERHEDGQQCRGVHQQWELGRQQRTVANQSPSFEVECAIRFARRADALEELAGAANDDHDAVLPEPRPNPKAIQYRLGHSSITVTLDRYGHLFPALDDALTDALDAPYRAADDADDQP
jgi:integrase